MIAPANNTKRTYLQVQSRSPGVHVGCVHVFPGAHQSWKGGLSEPGAPRQPPQFV